MDAERAWTWSENGAAFSPDGRWLASGADDGMVKAWTLAEGRERLTLKGHGAIVKQLADSPDGQRLAFGKLRPDGRRSGVLVRKGNCEPSRATPTRSQTSHSARTVGGSSRLGYDRTVKIWDMYSGRPAGC